MTQPQTVSVDQQEILSRADEVEAPMSVPPTDVPVAPSGLTTAINATEQIKLNADNIRSFLESGARERARLAASLRNAAKAYGEVDEESAAALDSDGGEVSEVAAGGVGGDTGAGLQDTEQVQVAGDEGYNDIEAVALKLEQGDQGASLSRMADGWIKLGFAMQGDVKRFRIFKDWEGDAAAACEESLDQQRQWIVYMAANATALGQQAQYMAELQSWARRAHPTAAAIRLVRESVAEGNKSSIETYAQYQKTSEQVLTDYNSKATEQVKAINPKTPPKAIKIDPPPPAQTPGLIPTQVMQAAAMAGGSGQGMQVPQIPQTGGAGGGMPGGVSGELASARAAASNLAKDLGVKPMSVGGGGGGGGMPAMPLAPSTGAGIGPGDVRPAGAGEIGGLAGGAAAGRGAAGGGGMGAPMGGQGQGGGGSKSKGSQQDDEALYTEDRAWTEAVIGQRRRQDMKESK